MEYLSEEETIRIIKEVISNNQDKVREYHKKCKNMRGQFVGQVLRGPVSYSGDPQDIDNIFVDLLKE